MSTDRPPYMSQIDQLLQERERVAGFVESGLHDIGSSQFRHLKQNLTKLRSVSQAESLLVSPNLIRLLPLLNRSHQQDAEGLIRSTQTWIEEESKISSSWARMFSYPSIMFTGILGIFFLQAFYLSPTFETMFAEFELRLPVPTESLFAVNRFIRSYGWLIIPLILIIHLAGKLIRYWLSLLVAALQKLYVFDILLSGRASNLISMSRFTRSLADLCELGVPVPNAVRYAGVASSHALYRLHANQLAQSIQNSTDTQRSWEAFPPYLSYALKRNDQAGVAVQLLRELASNYSSQASLSKSNYSGMTSPWFILLLGVMIFFLAMALFMPLVSLVTTLS